MASTQRILNIAGRSLFNDRASSSRNAEPVITSVPKTLHKHSRPNQAGFQNSTTFPEEHTSEVLDARDTWLIQRSLEQMWLLEGSHIGLEVENSGPQSSTGDCRRGEGEKLRVLSLELIFSLPSILSSLPRVQTNLDQKNLLGLKVFLVLLKLLLLIMIVTATGYVSTASEVQRKYSKSLLLLVVKLLLLVLVTTVREYYYC
ncbi:hypothetical protein Tco_1430182 [Tanacetum coccineum]